MLFSENTEARWARPQGNHDGPERRASRPSQGRDSRVSCQKQGRQSPGPHLHIVSPIHGSSRPHKDPRHLRKPRNDRAYRRWLCSAAGSHNARLAALLMFMLESKGQLYFFWSSLQNYENSLLGTGFQLSKMQRTLALGSSDDCLM